MTSVNCPHCRAANVAGSAFCASCGKALPSASAAGPRVVTTSTFAATTSGQSLQAEELTRLAKRAFGALLVVGVLQALFGTLLIAMANSGMNSEVAQELGEQQVDVGVLTISVYGVAVIYFGLALWARKSPLPAAIVGLVFFVTMHLLEALVSPRSLLNGIIVMVIIIVVLARAISAGLKYRTLSRSMA